MEEKFLQNFLEYFNENITRESPRINEECNLQNAKFIIVVDDFSEKEIKRCYETVIHNLIEQKLSIDYLDPAMISILREPGIEKKKDKRVSLVLKGVSARKPKKEIKEIKANLNNKDGLEKYKHILISHFNECYKIHKNKPNTYDTFEFVATIDEIGDKELFKKKFIEEAKNLEYKFYQLKPNLLEIEFINNNYVVRYNYGE